MKPSQDPSLVAKNDPAFTFGEAAKENGVRAAGELQCFAGRDPSCYIEPEAPAVRAGEEERIASLASPDNEHNGCGWKGKDKEQADARAGGPGRRDA
jgi:hypothetical protein